MQWAMSKLFLYGIGAIVASVLIYLLYLFVQVWSVGWINYDNTIVITNPETLQQECLQHDGKVWKPCRR